MGCSNSKDPVLALSSSNNSNSRSLAWSDETPLPAIKTSASSSSRKIKKTSSKTIRVSTAHTEVVDITQNRNAIIIMQEQTTSIGSGLADDPASVSSATSKARSECNDNDSGLEIDCPGMITEQSERTAVEKIETEHRPTTPDLSLVGTKLESRKRSGGKTKPQTAAAILGELQSEGLLITTPSKVQRSSTSFEVMIAPEFGVLRRPPPRLAKLKKRKTKQTELTKEEVEEKLKAAEARRKRKEAKMIARINTNAKERHVQAALDSFVESQRTQTQSKMTQELDAAAHRREEHFRTLKKKLDAKKEHAKRVRQAKQELLAQTSAPPEDSVDAEKINEDTSLV